MIYLEKYNGYIADNPNIDFIRCDGTVFSFDEVNTASVTNTANSQTITGGQGNYPLAYIDTDKALEITFASSQFGLDLFELSSATTIVEGDRGVYETKRFTVEEGLKVVLPFEVRENSVKIRGLEEADTAAAGKFAVAITAAGAEVAGKTEITFNEGDVTAGDTVRVSYLRRAVAAATVSNRTNGTTAKGELMLHWPVYSAGTDCTEASVKAYLHMDIFRCRATALPGFENSYKTAATNSITFAAIDPKRADNKMFDLIYEPLDSDGNIVSKSEAEVTW